MLTKKDEVEQFKRDLKSLHYYKNKRDEGNDRLLELSRIMHEPRANRYDQRKGNTTYNYIALMEEEDKLKKQQQVYDVLIVSIGNRLDKIENIEDRDLIIKLYIHKQSYEKMALEHFMSVRKMKYYVNSIISKI